MARPRKETPRWRLQLSFEPPEREKVEAYASTTGRPVATAISALVNQVLASDDAAGALAAGQARIRELEHELAQAQRTVSDEPRWSWPIQRILSDREWWVRWLPELSVLMGRSLRDRDRNAVADERGFGDLMTFLFPPVQDTKGRPCRWDRVEYPACARRAWEMAKRANRTLAARADRAEVWEPVIRHVVKALCALEDGSARGDAYMALRAADEIRGGWMEALTAMLGQGRQPGISQLEDERS